MTGSNRLAVAALLAGVAALVVAAVALGYALATPHGGSGTWGPGRGQGPMMGGNYGPMMGGNYGPMMGGRGWLSSPAPQPGSAGFVPGTPSSPRVVRIVAGPGNVFYPATVTVARGETVNFLVTTRGPVAHEFMVGPADAVAADREGTPEVDGIGMMQTRSLTYTFDGPGPYAYACHEPGHYESGMQGTIVFAP